MNSKTITTVWGQGDHGFLFLMDAFGDGLRNPNGTLEEAW